MHEYRIFLGDEMGAYGGLRTVWLMGDEVAIDIGQQMLAHTTGVDIWRGERRIALLTRATLHGTS